MSTVRWRRCFTPPTVLVTAAYERSVPTAVTGLTPNTMIKSGVISDPPPTPVMPTSSPTQAPKKTMAGSMSRPAALSVQAALQPIAARPAALSAVRGGARARHAADRRVAAVVQRVVRDVVARDVAPDVALRPVGERIRLEQLVPIVPFELARMRAGR